MSGPTAFQPSAFQNNAFQIGGPAPVQPTPGGGPWRRNEARAEDDRIILGAIEGFLKGDRWRTKKLH